MRYVIILLLVFTSSCKNEDKKELNQTIFCDNERYYFKNKPHFNFDLNLNQTQVELVKSIEKNVLNKTDLCAHLIFNSKMKLKNEVLEIPYIYRKDCGAIVRYNTMSLIINSDGDFIFWNELINIEDFKHEIASILKHQTKGLNINLLIELEVYPGLAQDKFNKIITEFYKGISMLTEEMSISKFRKSFCELNKSEVDSISSKFRVYFTNLEENVVEKE
tara:strand:- start:230 stop:886 length:657 start_codon:yes stop_codon:yes gene_type:complete